MTQFSDQIRLGAAYFGLQANWSGGGQNGLPLASAPQDTQVNGVPLTQTFYAQIGQASTAGTATAGRFFYSATGATGGITLTAFTNDWPRGARIFSSVNLSTVTFTLVGQDGYGQTQVWSGAGPTGNTLGNTGSYVDTSVTWHTITTASGSGSTGTTAFSISNNDTYGLPYVLSNVGMGLGVYIDGATASIAPTFTAAFTPTGTVTATTGDVRGTVALATAVLANGTRYITVGMIAPPVNLSVTTDNKVNSFGATPFAG
jgi:hypothetical protein